MTNDHDRVIKRIPIYLSSLQTPDDHLSKIYILQFPLQNYNTPLNSANMLRKVRAQYKPNCDLFQLALPIDPCGVTYSRQRGVEFGAGSSLMAEQVNSNILKSKTEDGSVDYLDHLIVEGSKASNGSSPTGNFMLGYLRGGELHISPVDSILQFRPLFSHVDGVEMQEQNNSRLELSEESTSELEEKKETTTATANNQVKKQALQKKQELINAQSSQHRRVLLKRAIEEEDWVYLNFIGAKDLNSDEKRQDLLKRLQSHSKDVLEPQKLEKCLFDQGLTMDLSSDATIHDLLNPDEKNGSIWYPGYYSKWFQSKIGYKDHETFITSHDLVGPIILSIHPQDAQTRGYVKALVRTSMGFHIVQVDEPKHTRTPSAVQKLKTVLSQSISHTKTNVLESILKSYFHKVKKIHTSTTVTSKDSGLSNVSDDQLNITKENEIWGTKKPSDFFNHINISDIVQSMELMPHLAISKRLHDLEMPWRATTFHVDLVNMNSQESEWMDFLKQIGLESMELQSQRQVNVKSKSDGDAVLRKHCIDDFIEKESNYVQDLLAVQEGFLNPLSKLNILSKLELNQLPKLNDIITINSELLCDLKQGKEEDEIGKILLNYPEKLKRYSVYVKSHSEMSQFFKELQKVKPEFRKYVQTMKPKVLKKKLDFEDVLISPVQKIPRYSLVIKELLKYTPENHKDYQNLKECLISFESLVLFLDQGIDREKMMVAVMELAKTIDGCPPDFVKSSRYLIEKFDVQQFQKQLQFYLFNDCILLAELKKSGAPMGKPKEKIKFLRYAELTNVDIVSFTDRGQENVFQIEINLTQFEQKNRIVLGVSELNKSLNHLRSTSQQSSLLSSSQLTLKSAEQLSNCGSKEILSFQSAEAQRICRLLKKQKIPTSSATTHCYEIDCNNDICFNIFSDSQTYRDSKMKSPILIYFIGKNYPEYSTIERDREVKFVMVNKLGLSNILIRSEELTVPQASDFVSSENIQSSLSIPSNDLLSKIVNVCQISLRYNRKEYQKDVETYQLMLNKINEQFGPKTVIKSNSSSITLGFKTMQRSSHSRRSSAKSLFEDSSSESSFIFSDLEKKPSKSRRLSVVNSLTKSFTLRKKSLSSIKHLDKVCDYIELQLGFIPDIYLKSDEPKAPEFAEILSSNTSSKFDTWNHFNGYAITEGFLIYIGINCNTLFGPEPVFVDHAQRFSSDEPLEEVIQSFISCIDAGQYENLMRVCKHLTKILHYQDCPKTELKILETWADAICSKRDEFVKDFTVHMLKNLSTFSTSKLKVGDKVSRSADLILSTPKHHPIEHRRSLDGLYSLAKAQLSPPVSKGNGSSLTSIDEGFQSLHLESPLKSRCSSVNASYHPVDDRQTPTPSRNSSKSVPRKPVQYMPKETIEARDNTTSNPNRRSVSLPVNTELFQQKLSQAFNQGKADLEKECQRMTAEIGNLKTQLKCLKSALDAELSKKQWQVVDSFVDSLSDACANQLTNTKTAIDAIKEETKAMEQLFKQSESENVVLREKLQQEKNRSNRFLELLEANGINVEDVI